MDLNKDAVATFIERGNAAEAKTGKALAAASDIVMLALTTSAEVEKVFYGDYGVLAGIRECAVLIDY
jgi:3-hydroxyisobutyrate dehydrogenase